MEESFPRILALHPGLDLGQLPEVWPASPHAEMDLQNYRRAQNESGLQVCLLLSVQPQVSHLTSLGIGFPTPKMGLIILQQVLFPRIWCSLYVSIQ